MKVNYALGTQMIVPQESINIVSQDCVTNVQISDHNCREVKFFPDKGKNENRASLNRYRRTSIYLKLDVICKMIDRFLTEKKMSKEDLAQTLDIKILDLERLISQKDIPPTLIPKINLPLIKLYCETKFA